MKMKVIRYILSVILLALVTCLSGYAQEVPGPDENIPFLITFGPDGRVTSWGDDDFSQTFFFTIPVDYKDPFYIRIYDADIGGKTDELNNFWNTRMVYSVYGGKGCYTDPDAKGITPGGNYKSGTLLATRAFGMDNKLDERWFTSEVFQQRFQDNL